MTVMKRLFALLLLAPSLALAQSAAYNLSQLAHGLESGGIVPCAFGGTGLTSAPTNGYVLVGNGTCYALGQLDLTLGVKNILPIANGGTGTATPGLVEGTNVTITGTWPNQTVNSSGGGTPGGTNGQVQFNNSGAFGGFTLGGDCTFSEPNITCTTSNGIPIVTTTGTQTLTNKSISGSEINSGTVGATYLPAALSSSTSINGDTAPASGGTLAALGLTQTFTATNTFAGIIDSGLTPSTSPICPNGVGGAFTTSGCSGGGMVYPGAGIANSTGSAWGTSYSTSGSGNVALTTSPALTTPILTGYATASLPTCNAGSKGSLAYTTDGTPAFTFCNGTIWSSNGGTTFTIAGTGCTPSVASGDATGGSITLAAGPCTSVTITFNGAVGMTAAHLWVCEAHDQSLQAAGTWIPGWSQTSSTTTSAVIPIPGAAGPTDVITFNCTPH